MTDTLDKGSTIQQYANMRLSEDLFGNKLKEHWLDERFIDFLKKLGINAPEISSPVETDASKTSFLAKQGDTDFDALLDDLLIRHDTHIYSMPLFTKDFCDMMVAEIRNIYTSGIDIQRPNTMNRYGVIVNQFGMEALMTAIQQCIQSTGIAEKIYGRIGANWDSHHSFVVEYAPGKDLGLDMHRDDAEVTLNICLGVGDVRGSQVAFWDGQGSDSRLKPICIYEHKQGHCLIHLGRHRHGALPIRQGERMNLIIWNRSSTWRKSAQSTASPYFTKTE